ncbi:MAG TPA: hypothetical protein VFJ85_04700 [Acidimicrobiales bacterium]|nr:hypothetical protein [Acidimicrobiales bacterium]
MTATRRDALPALRRARLRRRTAQLDLFEVFYQVYLTALLSGAAVLVLSDMVGDKPVTGSQLEAVRQHGPAAVGVLIGFAVLLGCRSGGHGGPLALEPPDVLHLLLAPLDRTEVLRRPALGKLRSGAGAGLAAGAGIGVVASHRLPGAAPPWIVAGALAGLVTGLVCVGAALVVSGRRVGRRAATAIGFAALAWPIADLVAGRTTSPFTAAGEVGMFPLGAPKPLAYLVLGIPALLAAWGLAAIGGLSLEAASRRAALVSELRFAATVRDLRAVLLLRRQLAQEGPRRRPWIRLGPGSGRLLAVWKRDVQGVLRWPAARILRALALMAAAGVALHGMWSGTAALLLVAGTAVWLVALEAVEGFAQERDHPDATARLPLDGRSLLARHLPASTAVLLLVMPAALAGALATGATPIAAALAVTAAVPAAACAIVGAVVTTTRGAHLPGTGFMADLAPEFSGFSLVFREAIPPALATAGLIPFVAAHHAATTGGHPVAAAAQSGVAVLILAAAALSVLSTWKLT